MYGLGKIPAQSLFMARPYSAACECSPLSSREPISPSVMLQCPCWPGRSADADARLWHPRRSRSQPRRGTTRVRTMHRSATPSRLPDFTCRTNGGGRGCVWKSMIEPLLGRARATSRGGHQRRVDVSRRSSRERRRASRSDRGSFRFPSAAERLVPVGPSAQGTFSSFLIPPAGSGVSKRIAA